MARLLGDRGVNSVLVARRQGALDEVAGSVATETRTLALDLSRDGADDALADATADLDVGLLVYNAGADPHMSRFLDQPASVWQEMVHRNCTTVLGSAHHFGGRMAARGRGGIVLVTSGAGVGGRRLPRGLRRIEGVRPRARRGAVGGARAPLGVDVLSMVLGPTDTPAFRQGLGRS